FLVTGRSPQAVEARTSASAHKRELFIGRTTPIFSATVRVIGNLSRGGGARHAPWGSSRGAGRPIIIDGGIPARYVGPGFASMGCSSIGRASHRSEEHTSELQSLTN